MVSIFPCDVHGRRIATRLGSAYVTVARGQDKRSRKLRLCSPCLADLLETYKGQWANLGDDDEVSLAEVCGACEKALSRQEDRYHCFVTTYERGDDRQDYFSYYCREHAQPIIDSLGLNPS